ncbi:hypothetical protein VPNG_05231 [Cytospora leucostoma]|uniref:Dehydrogenase FUB6 n=1 Tax=Cytospora leucostoma TaxID=1230097 RepID=A0A423X852_9PEZI|nr:hypothetical protein VPNG_05231 [Cytospora leucostoma]
MAPAIANKSLIFKSVPVGEIRENVDLVFEDRPVDITTAPPKGLIVKTLINGFDPHMRDRMRGPTFQSYMPGYEFNEPITAFSVAKVLVSDHERYQAGDIIAGLLPVSEYGVIPEWLIEYKPMAAYLIWKVENKYNIDLAHWVGALGLAGQTAWTSFYGLIKPKAGETIWVNAASGAVGEIVVQLAKKEGMRVIGSASSDEKAEYVVKELGADACFNINKERPSEALKRLAPEGLDAVYENVGGDHFQAAIEHIKWFGRIVSCGMVSQYNLKPEEKYGVTNLDDIFRKRITIVGFIYCDHNIFPQNIDNLNRDLPKWISEGSVKTRATTFVGIDKAQEAFLALFKGKTFGKATLRVAEP